MSMDATLQVRMDGQIKNNVEELTEAEIDCKLAASEEDILSGRILSQTEADERLKVKFHRSLY